MKVTPLFDADERLRLWQCGPISQFFPVKFQNGTEWMEIAATCAGCNRELRGDTIHGEVVEMFKEVFLLKAVAYCVTCEKVMLYHWVVKENGVDGYDKNGNWGHWQSKRVPWWEKMFRFFTPWISK